jgi:hypothetical protein
MCSLAERAHLFATPFGCWKRELRGAKPIAVWPLRGPLSESNQVTGFHTLTELVVVQGTSER